METTLILISDECDTYDTAAACDAAPTVCKKKDTPCKPKGDVLECL